MIKIALILALGVMVFTGWLYLGEKDAVRSPRADVVAAADSAAVALSQSADPERNTDANAEGIFKKHVQTPSALEDLVVKQSVKRRVHFSGSPSAIGQGLGARANHAERILQHARRGDRNHRKT